MPAVLLGSFVGAFLNVILPTLIILICLTVLLLSMSVQSWIKYSQIYKKENLMINQKKISNAPSQSENGKCTTDKPF